MKLLQVTITLSDEEYRLLSRKHDEAGIKILVGKAADVAIAKEAQFIEDTCSYYDLSRPAGHWANQAILDGMNEEELQELYEDLKEFSA